MALFPLNQKTTFKHESTDLEGWNKALTWEFEPQKQEARHFKGKTTQDVKQR
jgi:hypothetical protein